MRTLRLSNGLPVILSTNRSKIAAMVVGFSGGGRNDDAHLLGRHHALEHLLVGPTEVTPDRVEFAKRHERICRELNAETDESSMVIYAKTDAFRLRGLIRFMAEMARRPLIKSGLFAEENERIREEINLWHSEPQSQLDHNFNQLMFGGSSLAYGSIGTHQGIERIKIHHLRTLFRQLLTARRMVIVLVGGFSPPLVLPVVEEAFGNLPPGLPLQEDHLDFRQLRGKIEIRHRTLEKIQVQVGWPTFGLGHPDRIALSVLRNHLSSRESSTLRRQLDACGGGYANGDYLWHWRDIGQYNLCFSVFREKLLEALNILNQEIELTKHHLISREDLDLAVTSLILQGKDRSNDQLNTATFYARQYINMGETVPWAIYRRRLRAINAHHVRRVAREVLVRRRLFVIAQGALQGLPTRSLRRALGFRS